jgi:TIR domain
LTTPHVNIDNEGWHMSAKSYEYDVCFSFAGEQRQYVEELASLLNENKIRSFYDRHEQASLWGKDLYEHLDDVYRNRAKYCILFISTDYARKVWTSHERRSAQSRAFEQNEEYILPVRFDDTEIPGIRPTVGYIDAREVAPIQLASLIRQKLSAIIEEEAPKESVEPSGVPLTPEEQATLLRQRPLAWEYLLFGGVLAQGKRGLAAKDRDHRLRYASTIRHITDDRVALDYIGDAMNSASHMISEGIMRILDPAAQDWAFGEPGVSGNPDNIIHLGERFIGIFEKMYDWAYDLRGTVTSSNLERCFELGAHFMDSPIKQTSKFIDNYAEKLIGVSERLNDGEVINLELTLTLTIDEHVSEECHRELERIERGIARR